MDEAMHSDKRDITHSTSHSSILDMNNYQISGL